MTAITVRAKARIRRPLATKSARIRPQTAPTYQALAFNTKLGWMGLLMSAGRVQRLTLGHNSAPSALEKVLAEVKATEEAEIVARPQGKLKELVERLIAFSVSGHDDFLDVPVALGKVSAFQSSVVEACRKIPPGQTRSYGELAEIVGAPRAARAVGTCMRKNTVPLIIPCHRVVAAGGKLGGYSAPQGLSLKRKLLALESRGEGV